jgi:hypothetical protein
MDVEFSETSSRGHASLITIHGFRVQSYGERVSPGFTRGLRRLSERGTDDPGQLNEWLDRFATAETLDDVGIGTPA